MFLAITAVSRLLMAIICSSLAILMFIQLRKDRKSMIFGQYMFILSGYASVVLLTRILTQADTLRLVTTSVIFLALIPPYAFYLAVEYFEKVWQPWQRWYLRIEVVCISTPTIILCIGNHIFKYAHLQPDGLLIYERYFHTDILLGFGVLIFVPIVFWCIRDLIRTPRRGGIADRRMVVGLLLFCCAAFTFIVPAFLPYAPDGFLYVTGALLMAEPIFRQRLFNPMAELNNRLQMRADQLATLTRVSQQIATLMSLDCLLQAIAREIHSAFQYEGVSIFRRGTDADDLIAVASAGESIQPRVFPVKSTNPIGEAAVTQRTVTVDNLQMETRYANTAGLPKTGSLVTVPLILSESARMHESNIPTTIGVLEIYRKDTYTLSDDDLAVLDILAGQIAISIRNAELYEAAQDARITADRASEAKTRFLSVMSHELRTPLQVIINMSQFCQQAEKYTPEVHLTDVFRADLTQITQNGRHLHAVINNILDWSKIDAGAVEMELKPINPVYLLREAIESGDLLLKPGVTLVSRFADSLPYVNADDTRVKQVLLNLLSNACKFTERGSISVNAQRTDDRLVISVKDTGIGIPSEALPELFNPFRQAASNVARIHGGTGLGLAICKQYVELQGGQIWLESEVAVGTTVYFTLPIVNKPDIETITATTLSGAVVIFADEQAMLPEQVLILDMRLTDWDHLRAELQRMGHRLLRTTTPAEAEKMFHTLKPSISLVVLYPDSGSETKALPVVLNTFACHKQQVHSITVTDPAYRVRDIKTKLRGLSEQNDAIDMKEGLTI